MAKGDDKKNRITDSAASTLWWVYHNSQVFFVKTLELSNIVYEFIDFFTGVTIRDTRTLEVNCPCPP